MLRCFTFFGIASTSRGWWASLRYIWYLQGTLRKDGFETYKMLLSDHMLIKSGEAQLKFLV